MRDLSFDTDAKSFLDRFDPGLARKRRPVRPCMVELFGTTNSGKTSVMDGLYVAFKAAGFEVAKVPEGAEAVPPPRILPVYNFMTADYALEHARRYALDRNLHLVLFDRAIGDAVVRMENFVRDGLLTREESEIEKAHYLNRFNRGLFDLHVCLTTSVDVGLVRKYGPDHAKTAKYSTSTNPQTMTKMLQTHETVWNDLGWAKDARMLWVDTSALTIVQVTETVKRAMLAAFQRHLESPPP